MIWKKRSGHSLHCSLTSQLMKEDKELDEPYGNIQVLEL